jgi:beta-N-acetylhexosaminidase
MAFAPVVDILYNHECEEVLSRAFGCDHEKVAAMGKAYMDGLHKTEGVAATAKHFPGNGQDYRDAHLSNNINSFNHDKWMATYGHVYKTLIDGGLDAIMGGHILMPEYMAEIDPDINADTIMPGTLCKIIEKVTEQCDIPVIAGGLIESREEICRVIESGASAVSTGKSELWNAEI